MISLYDEVTALQIDDLTTYTVMSYPIQSPQPTGGKAGSGSDNDYSLSAWEYQDVTETIELLIRGTTSAELSVRTRAIQAYVDKVRQRQGTGMGPRVTIQVTLLSDSVMWESEILRVRFWHSNAFHELGFLQMNATLSFTRRYFWEAPRTQILTLTSSEDSAAGEVDVYNNDDATAAATNWVNIPASETHSAGVAGVLPSPAEIWIINDEAGTIAWREFYISNTVFSDPTNFDPFLLGSESAAATFAWSTAVEEVAWRWTPTILTDARLTDLAGRYYRILVAFNAGATTGVFLRAVVEVSVGGSHSTQYPGGRVYYGGGGFIDLGPVPIPPGGYDVLGTDVALRIDVYKPEGGSSSMTLDFVQLTPAGDGLFQRINQVDFVGSDSAPQEAIVIDGPKGTVYHEGLFAKHRHVARPRGLPVMLFPGMTNRLRFLYTETSGFVAGRKFEIVVWQRARRLDI